MVVIRFESNKRALVVEVGSALEIHGLTLKTPMDIGSTTWLAGKGVQYTGFVPSPIGLENGSKITLDGCVLEYMVSLKQIRSVALPGFNQQ